MLNLRFVDNRFINFRREKRRYLDEVVAVSFRLRNPDLLQRNKIDGTHAAAQASAIARQRRVGCS